MTKNFHIFTVILLILNTFESSAIGIDAISAAFAIFKMAESIWEHMSEMEALESLEEKMEALQKHMGHLNSKMEKIQNEIGNITLLIQNLPNIIQESLRLNDLDKYMVLLNEFYVHYQHYSKNISNINRNKLEEFAEKVISLGSDTVEDLVEQIRRVILPSAYVGDDKGILRSVADSLRTFTPTDQCKLNKSLHQIVYNIYNYIPSTMMKVHTMKMFSFALSTFYGKGNYTDEIRELSNQYNVNIKEDLELLRNVLQPLSRDIWKCDPTIHVEGQTYLQVTPLLQDYVQNLVDLNNKNTCSGTCESLDRTTKSYSCTEELCKKQRKCEGNVINCKTLKTEHLQVCLAHPYDHSRYDFIDIHTPHENHTECRNSQEILFLKTFKKDKHHCEYCFCYCDDKGDHLNRYFNMRPVMADIKNNRVITGLRFVNKNSIFHLQIQEAKLLPRGSIDMSTVTWVPVEDYKINDTNVTSGRDYHVLSWEQPRIDLNDILTDNGQVLTGIRLTEDEKGSFLRLQITGTTFNLSSGLLDTTAKDPHWISSKVSTTQLKLEKPKLSILSPSPSVPDSTSDSYMNFTHIPAEDIAEDTVPFLDAQPVESLEPGPLGGAGLYHKGLKGYGGFIAPKIITYDFYI